MKDPTLQDVAKASGFSTATVSRALNEPEKVTEATRERVLAVVKDLDYTPNFGARVMASNRTGTIGAVIPTMENAIFAVFLEELQRALASAGITLIVASSGYDVELERQHINAMIARGVDGVALIGGDRAPGVDDLLIRRGLQVVTAWNLDNRMLHHSVGMDNETAGVLIAERVFEYGHRRVAMLAGVTKDNDRAGGRLRGVACVAARHNCDMPIVECRYSIDEAQVKAAELLNVRKRPTALICGNDILGVGAINAAHELGLKVPQDVSVVGFDDHEIAKVVTPQLTTVRVPHRRMGRAVADIFISPPKAGHPVRRIAFEATLVERASVAPPPKEADFEG